MSPPSEETEVEEESSPQPSEQRELLLNRVWEALEKNALDISDLLTKCLAAYYAVSAEADAIKQWFDDNRHDALLSVDAERTLYWNLDLVRRELWGLRKACKSQTKETEQRAERIRETGKCVKDVVLKTLNGEDPEPQGAHDEHSAQSTPLISKPDTSTAGFQPPSTD